MIQAGYKTKTDEIEKEIGSIISYPDERLRGIIREIGFECDCCGKCCTSEFNDHVFLLDKDASRIIENAGKGYLTPAPYYDFCDNLGRFYVIGYALKNKPGGECIFYTGGRCEHYESRPDICKIYPYMLHREPDEEGNVEWRYIGGLGRHGLYHSDIDDETCKRIAAAVKSYEIAFLRQKIEFLHTINRHFLSHALKYSQQMYDRQMRGFKKGKEIEVYVFFQGKLEKETLSK